MMNTTGFRKNINVHNTFIIPNGLPLDKFKKENKTHNIKKKILFLEEYIKKRSRTPFQSN